MQRRTQPGSAKQIPLFFDLPAGPESESALRAAYRRLELSRRLSFEQVMAERAYAIGVRNLADAMARRVSSATQRTPGTDGIVQQHRGPWSSPSPKIRPRGENR